MNSGIKVITGGKGWIVVDYKQVFDAFVVFAADRSQDSWCDLWILCQRRMEALVKTKAKKLTVPLPEGDIDDIITDSTARVMNILSTANDLTSNSICGIFTAQNKKAFNKYNQSAKRWKRLKNAAFIMNIRFPQISDDCDD